MGVTSFYEEEMGMVFDSIPCGLSVYEAVGERIVPLFHNTAFFEILGYSEERRMDAKEALDLSGIHPEDLGGLKEKLSALIRDGGILSHTLRVMNDRENEYRWIRLDGSVREKNGKTLLFAVLNDVSGQKRLEKELAGANEKMEDIINAIPGGVAIYKVTDIFETVYFSDGVPELSGYTVEEYKELVKGDAADMTYYEDTAMVVSRALQVVRTRGMDTFEFRKQHRDGHIVWVHAQIKWIGEEDGFPLLHCVFHNISDLKEAKLEMDHLINSIPGGIAIYRKNGDAVCAEFLSDGVIGLSGYTRSEYETMIQNDTMNVVYEADRQRVYTNVENAMKNGSVLDVSYRIRHKNGRLIWIHMNGRRMGPLTERPKLYIVFTGMSAEARLFQSIANETADSIYVIDKNNYDLLYVNENEVMFAGTEGRVGQKCYAVLHGRTSPCPFCTLKDHEPDGAEHEMKMEGSDHFYMTRFKESDWNGIPAYVKYVRDVTEEVRNRKEKERLEEYFQTVIKNLPGGIAVVRSEKDGSMIPEFLSDGFAALTNMPMEQAWKLYSQDAMSGVHPDDLERVSQEMEDHMGRGESSFELVYRLVRGDGSYVWVKNTLSMLQSEEGEKRFYAVYNDVTKEREEQETIRRQFKERLMQHYGTTDPNALIMGHCNITRNQIIEISDHTDSKLLETFGWNRQAFFSGIGSLVVDEADRRTFLNTYLNEPAMAAFERNDTEQIVKCFIKLPKEEKGRYVQFKVNLVDAPDTGDVTGILTVTDITEQVINDRILHQLSVTSYDFVIDLNLDQDTFTILTCNKNANCLPNQVGCHSERVRHMVDSVIVPKDREQYEKSLDPKEIRRRLKQEGAYTFSFSIVDANRDIRTKNITVSEVDLRLGRVCLVRSDITDSVREQQGFLNIMAYTFDLVGFIDIYSNRLTMHTRQTVLENLPPYVVENYGRAAEKFVGHYEPDRGKEEAYRQFSMEVILQELAVKPGGYDFVFPYRSGDEVRYKQINVLWGDENHRTVCLVRADVTDMLAEERKRKRALENALELAKEASRAKSDFLSTMSHDIRTPMNAIMGMTALAMAHLDERRWVEDCLKKISVSSRHLLSLINDILDMSKIEQSKITLNHMRMSLSGLLEQLSAIMAPQAEAAGLRFTIRRLNIEHEYFYGDHLRINQILINLLSNAVKFTPEGGCVEFLAEEIEAKEAVTGESKTEEAGEEEFKPEEAVAGESKPKEAVAEEIKPETANPGGSPGRVRYRFTVRDTGIGMTDEFLSHLFEPFTRDATRVEGTGLGLSITKGLVDLMGGSITVESHVHAGTVFQVELECERAPKREPDPVLAGPGAVCPLKDQIFKGRRFLIAEDNTINAEILCELLKMQGAESDIRTDGALAVQAFRDAPPGTYDAVLMDIRMPEMNGYEATKAIRRMDREDAGSIPIIAMTANAFSEDVQAALEAGMNAHIAKPIDMDVLKTALGGAINGLYKYQNKI